VCAYVASALAALRAPLLRGALQEVAVVVREEVEEGAENRGRALEKVSFVLHRAAAGAGASSSAAAEVPLPDAGALEASFAAALVKLQHLPQAPPLQAAGAGGGGAAAAGAPRAGASVPLRTFEILGLATSRDGVDRSALMEEDVLEAGGEALLLPGGGGGAGPVVVGWPLKTIRLNEGGGGGVGGGDGASAATLTILVEAARPT
jgi:hypothetical protein